VKGLAILFLLDSKEQSSNPVLCPFAQFYLNFKEEN
jgi:hypothetical protein